MCYDNKHIFITGGNKLQGEVYIDGSKNSALLCVVAACLVTDGSKVTLNNIPDISDIHVLMEILELLGKKVSFANGVMTIEGGLNNVSIPVNISGTIRGSIYCLGLLVGTVGEARIGLPGGDKIGERPIDIHLEALEEMGMKYILEGCNISAFAPNGLKGTKIYLRFPSVGATGNIMIAASRAEGKTTISNAAKEPEIVDLANLLVKMGVKVVGAGTDNIIVYGSKDIHGEITHDIIPDRIEAGVLTVAAAITEGEVVIKNCIPYHNYPLLSVLKGAGVEIVEKESSIYIKGCAQLKSIRVTTMPFPGFPTDLQPLLSLVALKAKGESMISDMVFPNRFSYVYELARMGGDIQHIDNSAIIQGEGTLSGRLVEGGDIRAVTTLVCAGLIAKGTTEVIGYKHLKRGYHNLEEKLVKLGAKIEVK